MLTHRSDLLNLLFILISFVLAVFLPFELFLFSYAFLGPLHYLTEINWLKSKKYFSKSNFPIYFIIAVTLIVSLLYLNAYFEIWQISFKQISAVSIVTYFILISFMFVLFTELLKDRLSKYKHHVAIIFATSLLLTFIILKNNYHAHLATFVFLPTLIHVFVFTLLFMWMGYLKSPNAIALISLISMLAIPMLIFQAPSDFIFRAASVAGVELYKNSGFNMLNNTFLSYLSAGDKPSIDVYNSAIGLKIQSFIAFAYTYHYLNWFAKINIIGWAKSISKINISVIILIWLFAIGLYLYNFRLGLIVLFFMSLGHVLLEFPLNIKVMKGIFSHYQIKFFR